MNQRAHATTGPSQTAQSALPKQETRGIRPPTQSRPPAAPDWSFAEVSVYPPGGDRGRAETPDGAAPANPAWQASNPLWYFNGEPQSAPNPTRTTLSASGGLSGTFLWRVSEGADKARLVDADAATGSLRRVNERRVELESTDGSRGEDDVVVEVSRLGLNDTPLETGAGRLGVRTPAGTRQVSTETSRQAISASSSRTGAHASAAYPGPPDPGLAPESVGQDEQPPPEQQAETAQAGPAPAAPHHLYAKGSSHAADATWVYASHINYEVIDDKGAAIKGFDVNEQWDTGVVKDDPTSDWRRGPPGAFPSTTTMFADLIGGETPTHTPAPTAPGSPLGTTKVQHWGQSWYIGSQTPGKGTKVQTDTLQKYLDHGEHLSVKSPP